jgi:hypothetical protein
MRNWSQRFFLTIGVVHNVPLRMTGSSMATGCDVIKCHVIESEHVLMRNRKLRNIHLSGAFSPEATSSNVTWPRSSFLGRVGSAHAQQKVRDFSLLESFDRNNAMKRHVTRRTSPGKYGSAHARSEVPLWCSLWYPGPITLSFSSSKPFHWLSAPFPPFYFHWERLQ